MFHSPRFCFFSEKEWKYLREHEIKNKRMEAGEEKRGKEGSRTLKAPETFSISHNGKRRITACQNNLSEG